MEEIEVDGAGLFGILFVGKLVVVGNEAEGVVKLFFEVTVKPVHKVREKV